MSANTREMEVIKEKRPDFHGYFANNISVVTMNDGSFGKLIFSELAPDPNQPNTLVHDEVCSVTCSLPVLREVARLILKQTEGK